MGVSWRPIGCPWAFLGLQNSLLGRLWDALGPLQVPSWTLKTVAGPYLCTQRGPKAAGELIFEVPMMDFCMFFYSLNKKFRLIPLRAAVRAQHLELGSSRHCQLFRRPLGAILGLL